MCLMSVIVVRGHEEGATCREQGWDGKISDFFLDDETRKTSALVWGLQRIKMKVLQLRF